MNLLKRRNTATHDKLWEIKDARKVAAKAQQQQIKQTRVVRERKVRLVGEVVDAHLFGYPGRGWPGRMSRRTGKDTRRTGRISSTGNHPMLIREQGRDVKLLRLESVPGTRRTHQVVVGVFRADAGVPTQLLEALTHAERWTLLRWLVAYRESQTHAKAQPMLNRSPLQLETHVTALDLVAKAQRQQIKQTRADLERKMMLVGETVLRRVERGEWDESEFLLMMDEALSRPTDRALFELDET